MTYTQVKERLEQIEADLAERQPQLEEWAEKLYLVKRDWERLWALTYVATDDSKKVDDRRHETLLAIITGNESLWTQLKDAEARYESLKAAIKTLETRSNIGMSLLKSMTREAGPMPAWSGARTA